MQLKSKQYQDEKILVKFIDEDWQSLFNDN